MSPAPGAFPVRACGALTLVELLVVIGIISLLAAILFPVLTRSKAAARVAKCQGNLRQIAAGLAMYLDDHARFPSIAYDPAIPALQRTWYVRLEPYVLNQPMSTSKVPLEPVFLCPEGRTTILSAQWGTPGVENWTKPVTTSPTYGYNTAGTLVNPPGPSPDPWSDPARNLGLGVECRESFVRVPGDMLAIGCQESFGELARRITPYDRLLWPSVVGARHQGSANMLFCDGHLELAKKATWTAATDTARRRWNNDNQAHPETWR